jgi:hypothetical protein
MTCRFSRSRWACATNRQLIPAPLGNATEVYPAGDEVQTVELWEPPSTWAGIDGRILTAILKGRVYVSATNT